MHGIPVFPLEMQGCMYELYVCNVVVIRYRLQSVQFHEKHGVFRLLYGLRTEAEALLFWRKALLLSIFLS